MGKKNKISTENNLVTEKNKKFSTAKLESRKRTVLKMIDNHRCKINKKEQAIARLMKEIQNLDVLQSELSLQEL